MIYRRFGRTNLQMPVVSCGGMRYQHKWQDVPLSEVPDENQKNLEATIRRAVDCGINHIETARGYGSSERQLGLVLPRFPRQELIVQTKISPTEDPDKFVREFEESLARLQLDYVDLLAIHGINDQQTLDWSIGKNGCLAKARQIQKRGLARHVGFATHGPTDIITAAINHPGDGGFDYVNLHWYYIFQRNWPAIEAATGKDMGVFIISPSDKGGLLYQPSERLLELCRPLHPITFNDLFCLSHPQVHTLSIGASRPSDFDLHLEAVAHLDRAAETLAPILDRLRARFEAVIPAELRQPLSLPIPEWDKVPGQINIKMILWMRNLALAYDMIEFGKFRYNLLGHGGNWFPGNNASALDGVDFAALCSDARVGSRLRELLKETHDLLVGDERYRMQA